MLDYREVYKLMQSTALPDTRTEASTKARSGRVRRWVRSLFRPLCFGGLVAALAFFWISLTPSLLPRTWLFQGVVSGLSAVIGYGVGSLLSALGRVTWAPPSTRRTWALLAGAALIGSSVLGWQSHRWQNELRALVGIHDQPGFSSLGVVMVTLLVAGFVLIAARLVRSLAGWLIYQIDRVLPRWIAVAVGVALTAVLVVGLFQRVVWRGIIGAINQAASIANEGTSPGTRRPITAERSGGPESLVAWESLGMQGREFVGRGPSVADLEAFHGAGCCRLPIRVYVGLDSAASTAERAALAVQEMERAGAFDRAVLGIFTATGTGWVDPNVADALEYLHRGDTAAVSLQYSFLPSWVSFLVDHTKAQEAGRELIGAVLRRVETLPPAERPKVLLFGESLGSYGTEQAFTNLADLRAHVDGALLVGPTFSNPIWNQLVSARERGSPQWLAMLQPDSGVYFARTPADLAGVAEQRVAPRVVYLQNASDPVTWWSPQLAFRRPDWAGAPAAPDRSPAFRWFPVVTFAQVVMDLANAVDVPAGHGHSYGANVVDGWIAVWEPDGWSDAATQRLRELLVRREG